MNRFSDFESFEGFRKGASTAVTIGVFDGLHAGHKALLSKTVQVAADVGVQPVVITFNNHPLSVLAPPYAPRRLIYPDRKNEIMAALGCRSVISVDFRPELAGLAPEEFVSNILVKCCGAKAVVCGYDFSFGRGGSGNISLLRELGQRHGFEVLVLDAISDKDVHVKSSAIRDLLFAGKVAEAGHLLTRPYELRGDVTAGFQRGRKIGFPTANLEISEEYVIPARGVYFCGARVHGSPQMHYAMVNIGYNPTFGLERLSIEAHILRFSDDIAGQVLELHFLRRLRDERRFESVDALIEQLEHDRNQCSALIDSSHVQELLETANHPDKPGWL